MVATGLVFGGALTTAAIAGALLDIQSVSISFSPSFLFLFESCPAESNLSDPFHRKTLCWVIQPNCTKKPQLVPMMVWSSTMIALTGRSFWRQSFSLLTKKVKLIQTESCFDLQPGKRHSYSRTWVFPTWSPKTAAKFWASETLGMSLLLHMDYSLESSDFLLNLATVTFSCK